MIMQMVVIKRGPHFFARWHRRMTYVTSKDYFSAKPWYTKFEKWPTLINHSDFFHSFLHKLINGKDKKYAKLLYDLSFKLQQENRGNIVVWFENIKSILNHSGHSNIWLEKTTHSTKCLKAKIKLTMTD